MVVDSSALMAILLAEAEERAFRGAIRTAANRLMSGPTRVECGIVALARRGDTGLEQMQALIEQIQLEVVPLSSEHTRLAIEAFRRFGKGRHPAGLNFGDCFSYALAKATGEPLLFKGADFSQTDIKPAL